ncbi:MAG: hypothetical protein JRK53_02650 [Deltaproteobacteria bacterium]|nr:hypothetical protein [Deltaproteobacteria bacterium]MBW1816308.1 hypothetical protein [Deltaproteobacteria bacterium]
MKRRSMKVLWQAPAVVAVLSVLSCALQTGPLTEPPKILRKAPGYAYVLGALTAYDMTTPPYLPGQMRFFLDSRLRSEGLLAASESNENSLKADVQIRAIYSSGLINPGGATSSLYDELVSNVRVVDLRTDEVIATARFRAYNGYGEMTSDFTEQEHARDIGNFLVSIVR